MQILKTLVVALLVAGVIPLLLGLLFELVIVAPLRVPLDQTPLFYPWQVCWWSHFAYVLIVMHIPAELYENTRSHFISDSFTGSIHW